MYICDMDNDSNKPFTWGLPPDHIQISRSGEIWTCTKCFHSCAFIEDGKTDLDQCKIDWINRHLHYGNT